MSRFKKTSKSQNSKPRNAKRLNYAVSNSSASTYKDGARDVKEHVEVKNSKMNLIADRGTGKEELDVKIQKEDAKKTPKTQKKKLELPNYSTTQ